MDQTQGTRSGCLQPLTPVTTTTTPAPRWLRFLFARPLGWLVYHANRRFRTETWYALKDRVLSQWSSPDGCDLQVLPPNECWSCEKGKPRDPSRWGLRSDGTCARCDGHGNYSPERYVRLERRKLGPYVFHKPTGSAHSVPLMHQGKAYFIWIWKPRNIIHGLILHKPNKLQRWLGYRTRMVLELLFDTRRFVPHLFRHCFWRQRQWAHEQRRMWSYGCHPVQQPRWSPWHRPADWQGLQHDDLPF